MELSDKDKSELKRLAEFNRNWRTMSMVGKIAILFSVVFIIMGIYVYVTIIPRFSNLTGSTGDDLKIAYSLWCYTFVLLGFSTFITGFILVSYCRDLHILFTLYERVAPGTPAPGEKETDEKKSGEKNDSEGT